nr:MAG TPA: hypothetical protein [Caudoviricetes sp.]
MGDGTFGETWLPTIVVVIYARDCIKCDPWYDNCRQALVNR